MLNKIKKHSTINTLLFIALYASLPLFLFFTNPQNLPLPLLIVPIVLLFLIFYVTIYYLILKGFNKSRIISKTRLFIITAIVAMVPVLLIVLASIRQFTLRDIILSTVIVICISWYLLKVDFLKT
jgi:hypothetical protein